MKGKVPISVLFGTLAALLLVSTIALSATSTVTVSAPNVVTVPWRGTLNLPHETYNGKLIHLKGVARGLITGATASWDPGDGTGSISVTPSFDANGYAYDLGTTHTYGDLINGPIYPPGTPFTAVLTVCNPSGSSTVCASKNYSVVVRTRNIDGEIDIAIDEGLWWSHRSQYRNTGWNDGGWFSQGDVSPTAANVQAFQINNYFEGDDPNFDPYADDVARGLKFLLSRLRAFAIGNVTIYPAFVPTMVNPDSNGNGLAVDAPYYGRTPYETGQVMDAIVASKTPNKLTTTGPNGDTYTNIDGRTYKDLVQDMVDAYAWGQARNDSSDDGGWRYDWVYYDSDNSACQWGAIGILAARDIWNCTVPSWVYSQNLNWLSYSQAGAPAYGYGYASPGAGIAESPSGLVQLIMDGIPKTDTNRWVGVENYMVQNWWTYYEDGDYEYALYDLVKAMRLALPSPMRLWGQQHPPRSTGSKQIAPTPITATTLPTDGASPAPSFDI